MTGWQSFSFVNYDSQHKLVCPRFSDCPDERIPQSGSVLLRWYIPVQVCPSIRFFINDYMSE